MKSLLTVAVCTNTDNGQANSLYDGLELIYRNNDESEKAFLARAIKSAKGKYTVICDRPFVLGDIQALLHTINGASADLIKFTYGGALKTSILKGVKDYTDAFSCRTFAIMECKNLLKMFSTPIIFKKEPAAFTEENTDGILSVAEEFKKVKAKLPKEIYTIAFDMLCDRLVAYYLYAILAVRDGNLQLEKLIAFDSKLKGEIVLYLALEKRFTVAKLHKLRNKNFKISGLTAKKFKKLLN